MKILLKKQVLFLLFFINSALCISLFILEIFTRNNKIENNFISVSAILVIISGFIISEHTFRDLKVSQKPVWISAVILLVAVVSFLSFKLYYVA